MNPTVFRFSAIASVLLGAMPLALAFHGPFDGRTFQGRIAYSCDGNYNDPDDWGASPVALAIFAECGVKDKVVHFDYNCIFPLTDPAWEETHTKSIMGAADYYGYDKKVLIDCRKDRQVAIDDIARIIDESSADNPLFFILAGPMEIPYLGIQKSNPEKRKYVYCISHSRWNDGFSSKFEFINNKRDVIPQGIAWIQVQDQNQFLSASPYGRDAEESEWAPFHWMRDAAAPNLKFLWERLRTVKRPDCSDAGMAYFLMTGDELSEIEKVRALLEFHTIPKPIAERSRIRLEAENFRHFDGFELETFNERAVSHRLGAKSSADGKGRIATPFNEPYTAPKAIYNVDVRYLAASGGDMALLVNGKRQGASWSASGEAAWKTHTVQGVAIADGDEIALEASGAAAGAIHFDYVELNRAEEPIAAAKSKPAAERQSASAGAAALDDPSAMPGQIIVAGSNPGYLKYNGGGPAFISGPDNPEEFLFRGDLNPDGTRSGGDQLAMIETMARTGVNAFHCQMFRMRRCNIKDEGDDQHCPFVDFDPAKPLNEAMLAQWDEWIGLLEDNGILLHLEFYNDATDVEMMGWTLDADGNLHPDEHRFIEGIVNRFKHRKNILWGIEESANKVPRERTAHFKKIGEVIARADEFNHPIVQSFVVPNDPDKDFPANGALPVDYAGDPHIRVATWLHVIQQGEDLERMHREYLRWRLHDRSNMILMKNETFGHPRFGDLSRRYMWSCAMAGMHTFEALHPVYKTREETLADDGRIATFMERTDFHAMAPRDDLAEGSAKWALANPDESYIVYTWDYDGPMGVKDLIEGTCDLLWFDTVTGRFAEQPGVAVEAGANAWAKPEGLGKEIALYVKRKK